MSYFDATVIAVPQANRDAFIAHARQMWTDILKPAGALAQVETWGDDVPDGKVTSFPMAVQCRDDEAVVFSWIEWPDKETRDATWARIMEDGTDMGEMPFDGQRMIFGGFRPVVSERA
ncbi:DUF1428 domain-containing protein [Jannaschia rubra]|uniref:RNA signal recognition particle 4.5S RNA n=1 Tax=Jannaschia rubra TaxID=282197 RepID=A0A0M6XM42_9RHOB|nr:DUF1428 domain-containing protein [Jannaschia rubra]CTQ32216.1 hypothetical protein JAN5088_00979 [Jannaschia rubra]SFG34821.1 Uncharacterized conserved protein YbaA, DUF1428 family [Jannaschia rubra]